MSAWAEADALREQLRADEQHQRERRTKGTGPLCCFAKMADLKMRFRARIDEARIRVEVMPYEHPRDWRVLRWVTVRSWMDVMTEPGGPWRRALTPDEAFSVLVVRDAWIERGGGRMVRPTIIGTPPAK